MAKGFASCETVAGPLLSVWITARRVGSARALKVVSMARISLGIYLSNMASTVRSIPEYGYGGAAFALAAIKVGWLCST